MSCDQQQQAVAQALARILNRRHPGVSWTPANSSGDTSARAVVVQLASPSQLDTLNERRRGAARTM